MKTLQLSSFGAPADVVELTEVDPADPGPGQLAVSIEAAPINPSDLNLIRGIYGVRPDLPAALGAEGVGRVIAVGDGVDGSRIGTRVPRDTVAQTYHTLATLVSDGTLAAPIEATYALADYREAIAHAARSDRNGKVLFDLG